MKFPENMPSEHHHQIRQLYRLILSYTDFKHAKRVAEYILSSELLSNSSDDPTIVRALYCSMIMAYCRPFSGNSGSRGYSIPDLPAGFLRLLNSKERDIHSHALFIRNKYVAHTDAQASSIEPVRVKIGDTPELLMPLTLDRLAPFNEKSTTTLLSAATKLLTAVVEKRAEIEPSLMHYFPAGKLEDLFNFSDSQNLYI